MKACRTLKLLGFMLAAAGCLSDNKKLATVSTDPLRNPGRVQAASFKQAPKATQEIALRVDRVGQKILAANPRINQKVVFFALGVPHEEIFHQSNKEVGSVYVTEGLVKQCKNDDELAAVLSEELGKMVAEQMVRARPSRPPLSAAIMLNPPISSDVGGAIGSADRTNDLIATRYERDWRQSHQALPTAPPPPETLARSYLICAGFDPKSLEAVKPLLRKADKQSGVELSMTGKQGS